MIPIPDVVRFPKVELEDKSGRLVSLAKVLIISRQLWLNAAARVRFVFGRHTIEGTREMRKLGGSLSRDTLEVISSSFNISSRTLVPRSANERVREVRK